MFLTFIRIILKPNLTLAKIIVSVRYFLAPPINRFLTKWSILKKLYPLDLYRSINIRGLTHKNNFTYLNNPNEKFTFL